MFFLENTQFIVMMVVVKQNFKGKVLKIVTGDFKLFKIPVPYGHIWDSF